MASNLLPDSIQDSLKQILSTTISEIVFSQAQSLIPELLRSLKIPVPGNVNQIAQTFPLNTEPRISSPAENVNLCVVGKPDTIVDHVPAIPVSQTQQCHGRGSYRQVLAPEAPKRPTLMWGPTDFIRAVDDCSNMKAQRKGDDLSVKIDDDLVQREVARLQETLIGKITLASGDSPYSLEDLYSKLSHVEGLIGD